MEKLPLVLALLACLSACSPYAEEKKALKAAFADWSLAKSQIETLSQQAQTEMEDWKDMYQGMEITDEQRALLSEDELAQLDQLKTNCEGHGRRLQAIHRELDALRRESEALKSKIDQLLTSLEHGTAPEDLPRQVMEVEAVLEQSEELAEQQEVAMQTVKSDCIATCREYADIVHMNTLQ